MTQAIKYEIMTDELVERVLRDGPARYSEEIWRLFYPEPDKGPWYRRNPKWKSWDYHLWYFEKWLHNGQWLRALEWLYPRHRMPEMIHTDPAQAFATALDRIRGEG